MKVLLTGFDPFGIDNINPSWEMARSMPDTVGGNSIAALRLPTSFFSSGDVLIEAIEEQKPDAVICTGVADGRNSISIEKVAINYMDARIPDNSQSQPRHQVIEADGPDAYFTGLPTLKLLDALKAEGIPGELSYSAGTYVCNYIFYILRHYNPALISGFIHVPLLPDQMGEKRSGTPFMPLEMMVSGMKAIVAAL
ncbi:pyroglutamyl-peptidase I [Salinispira pacifica]|uniref:Pyroglutamyl-peptidase I n=1 Tax=Salinispira pacifica TaxID=1307761 RepID=V5WFZ4_9SPIO|nr:pyroglutamyl-peptidase I [Salinispira pacifica]AHC14076.1 Pyrrolidone-carboxylate peptidase [Salinispira pacifica]